LVRKPAVEHEAGAVKVVVNGPLFRKPRPPRVVALGMVFIGDDDYGDGYLEQMLKEICLTNNLARR
jgi:hypothetical protein